MDLVGVTLTQRAPNAIIVVVSFSKRGMDEDQLLEMWGDGGPFGIIPQCSTYTNDEVRMAAMKFAAAVAHKAWERGYTESKAETSIAIRLLTTAASKEWERGYGEGFDEGFFKAVGIKDERA